MTRPRVFVCLAASVLMFCTSAMAAVVGTIDVGDFGPGGFVDGGVDPAAQNVVVTGSITGTVTYTGQWGSEQGSGASDVNDNHVFDGEAGFTAHTGGSTLTVVFDGLTAGLEYDVAATWRGQGNAATNAPYQITGFDGGAVNVTKNQEIVASPDFTEGGFPYEILASGISSGTSLTVVLNNNADEFVVADAFAVNLVPEPSTLALCGLSLLGLAVLRRRS